MSLCLKDSAIIWVMESIKRITKGDITYALLMKSVSQPDGVRFLTEQQDNFQVGFMNRPAGYEVKPHTHPPYDRSLTTTSEFLLIQEGRVKIQVFDDAWEILCEEELVTGDSLIFFRGGHALTMLEPTKMIEVKQGPYPGDTGAKTFHQTA
jgi:mannose-6-phosphate isomerase-like protein (cupin superfamily)